MKITKLRAEVVHLPFGSAIKQEGLGELRSVDCVLVFLETDAGLIGEGLVYSINKQRVAPLHEMVRSFEPLVVRLNPEFGGSFVSRAWSAIGAFGHAGMTVVGMAGIDEAIFDLRAKAAGLNVSHLLGACRKAVPVYRSVGLGHDYSLDQLQRAAADFVKSGFRGMKMNVGKHSLEEDVRRVRAVREAIGPDISLMADLNQRLTAPQAIRLGRALEQYSLAWLEEPVRYYDHVAEAAVAAALDTPIASGEIRVHFSRNPTDAAAALRGHHYARSTAHGRTERLPQGHEFSRSVQHPCIIPPLPRNEFGVACDRVEYCRARIHAVVRTALS